MFRDRARSCLGPAPARSPSPKGVENRSILNTPTPRASRLSQRCYWWGWACCTRFVPVRLAAVGGRRFGGEHLADCSPGSGRGRRADGPRECAVPAGDVSGLMADAVLDDPGFPAARERSWTAALTDERLPRQPRGCRRARWRTRRDRHVRPALGRRGGVGEAAVRALCGSTDHGTDAGPGGGGVCGEPTNRMRDQVVATHRPRGDDAAVRLCGWRSPTRRSGCAG